jgi:hypothetical protein
VQLSVPRHGGSSDGPVPCWARTRKHSYGLRQWQILRKIAEYLGRGLRRTLEGLDLCDGIFEGTIAFAFAHVGGVEQLFLSGDRRPQSQLVVTLCHPCAHRRHAGQQRNHGGRYFENATDRNQNSINALSRVQ